MDFDFSAALDRYTATPIDGCTTMVFQLRTICPSPPHWVALTMLTPLTLYNPPLCWTGKGEVGRLYAGSRGLLYCHV